MPSGATTATRSRIVKLTYAVVFEQVPSNYSAYAPDVPGCVGTGVTWDETLAMIREALTFHIEALIEDGDPVPEPTMSIDDAIAYHSEPIPEDVLDSYGEFGEPAFRFCPVGPHVDLRGCVAGVRAPAFVERSNNSARASTRPTVSPGFAPRPSLSGNQAITSGRQHMVRVAGVRAPAFVERSLPRPGRRDRTRRCRRGSRPGLR